MHYSNLPQQGIDWKGPDEAKTIKNLEEQLTEADIHLFQIPPHAWRPQGKWFINIPVHSSNLEANLGISFSLAVLATCLVATVKL